jgi:pimeloyl-ACP methyl ester carboxylesterase
MVFTSALRSLHPTERNGLLGDVVFIHGLNSSSQDCWSAPGGEFWPSWLVDEFKDIGVWAIDYGAAASDWFSERKPMPIAQRAINLLELLNANGLGRRPLVFITHSMGGLMAKQMLRHARTESKNAAHQKVGEAVEGIVFIATPHRGAALANWMEYFRLIFRRTVAVTELQLDSGFLISLADWFEIQASQLKIKTLAFSETRPTHNFMIVNSQSADPGNVQPIPLDANHIEISKPSNRQSLLYPRVAIRIPTNRRLGPKLAAFEA